MVMKDDKVLKLKVKILDQLDKVMIYWRIMSAIVSLL